MTAVKNPPFDDLDMLLSAVQQSFSLRRHWQLFSWLQEDLRQFVPHDIAIAAWGDFRSGVVCYDVLSPLPGMRTRNFGCKMIHDIMSPLLARWLEFGNAPYLVRAPGGFSETRISDPLIDDAMGRMQCCLVHGIKDQRAQHDCIYALLGPAELGSDRARLSLRLLLPYIDMALRQVAQLPQQQLKKGRTKPFVETMNADDSPYGLSLREREVMNWVCMGKTNREIGMVMEISGFTVKNHLQRIFRKLDVMNRAQAAFRFEAVYSSASH